MQKLSQKQQILYRLLKNRTITPKRFMPIWEFIGEFHIVELGYYGYISYEVSARMSELWRELPEDILEREYITGKSGAIYYGYRIKPHVFRISILENEEVPDRYKDVVNLLN